MNRLSREFGDQITFINLYVDDPANDPVFEKYGFRGRSEYVLVDANDTIVGHWFGPLDEAAVMAKVREFVDG